MRVTALVELTTCPSEFVDLLEINLESRPVIEYVVEHVFDTVEYALGTLSPSPPSSDSESTPHRGRSCPRAALHQQFTAFVSTVLTRARVSPPTLLVALVYISRVRSHLSVAAAHYILERVFLGALVVANKYMEDRPLKNIHWAMATGFFGTHDMERIEREFLSVLDWELGVREADLMPHYRGLLAAALGPKGPRVVRAAARKVLVPCTHKHKHSQSPEPKS
ncbi:hypothetical protein B0H11DRAFT_1150759 [Mycena galericulata]|nr:hypothetical protein B0H11DRAFT_1150759 [Mycena galericulata]